MNNPVTLGFTFERLFLGAEKERGTAISNMLKVARSIGYVDTYRVHRQAEEREAANAKIDQYVAEGIADADEKISTLNAKDRLAALERSHDLDYLQRFESCLNLAGKVLTRTESGAYIGDTATLSVMFEQFKDDPFAVQILNTRYPGAGALIAPGDSTGQPQELIQKAIKPLFISLINRYKVPEATLLKQDIPLPEFTQQEIAAFILIIKELKSFETTDFEAAADKVAADFPDLRLGAASCKWKMQTNLATTGTYPEPVKAASYDELMQAFGYAPKQKGEE